MKKLLCALFVLCLLCGCGGEKETKTLVCSGVTSGIIDVTNTLTYENDKVLKQTIKNEVSLEALNVDATTMESLTKQFETAYDINGVNYKWEIKDNVFVEEITVDFEKADFEALKKVQLIDAQDDSSTVTYISLEQTRKVLEGLGMTCK